VNHLYGQFIEQVYVSVYQGKWEVSTARTEIDRLRLHLFGQLGERALTSITCDELQNLLTK
jgi:hypothetical protein